MVSVGIIAKHRLDGHAVLDLHDVSPVIAVDGVCLDDLQRVRGGSGLRVDREFNVLHGDGEAAGLGAGVVIGGRRKDVFQRDRGVGVLGFQHVNDVVMGLAGHAIIGIGEGALQIFVFHALDDWINKFARFLDRDLVVCRGGYIRIPHVLLPDGERHSFRTRIVPLTAKRDGRDTCVDVVGDLCRVVSLRDIIVAVLHLVYRCDGAARVGIGAFHRDGHGADVLCAQRPGLRGSACIVALTFDRQGIVSNIGGAVAVFDLIISARHQRDRRTCQRTLDIKNSVLLRAVVFILFSKRDVIILQRIRRNGKCQTFRDSRRVVLVLSQLRDNVIVSDIFRRSGQRLAGASIVGERHGAISVIGLLDRVGSSHGKCVVGLAQAALGDGDMTVCPADGRREALHSGVLMVLVAYSLIPYGVLARVSPLGQCGTIGHSIQTVAHLARVASACGDKRLRSSDVDESLHRRRISRNCAVRLGDCHRSLRRGGIPGAGCHAAEAVRGRVQTARDIAGLCRPVKQSSVLVPLIGHSRSRIFQVRCRRQDSFRSVGDRRGSRGDAYACDGRRQDRDVFNYSTDGEADPCSVRLKRITGRQHIRHGLLSAGDFDLIVGPSVKRNGTCALPLTALDHAFECASVNGEFAVAVRLACGECLAVKIDIALAVTAAHPDVGATVALESKYQWAPDRCLHAAGVDERKGATAAYFKHAGIRTERPAVQIHSKFRIAGDREEIVPQRRVLQQLDRISASTPATCIRDRRFQRVVVSHRPCGTRDLHGGGADGNALRRRSQVCAARLIADLIAARRKTCHLAPADRRPHRCA